MICSTNNYENLILNLEALDLKYEIVKIILLIEDIKFKTKRKDVFCFGSLKMAWISKKYQWDPEGVL